MPGWKLTREEIRKAFDDAEPDFEGAPMIWDGAEAIALTAQKRLAKWGNEPCPHWEGILTASPPRRTCVLCWQALCKELGVK